ncbi:MANSC domain-containing protein 1 [Spea bombifrons]|uniref:MANSC domain-containing protein 1 n=1 Tax=Spea bombifrons TaxID=233779 RepID=UPI00234AF15A|nr:MANSC domain-containing protein 1 [Spea bombifrons]
MGVCSVSPPWAVLLFALLWGGPAPCAAQTCVSHPMPNMVIDIEPAVSHGVRSADPIHTSTMEECSAACCSEHSIAGNRDCNLYIYDTRKIRAHPNCYMFNCPTPESCKMTPAEGVMSYSLWTESSGDKGPLYSSEKRQKQEPISSKRVEKVDAESSAGKVSGSELRPQVKGSGSAVHAQGSVEQSQRDAAKEPGSTLRSQSSASKEPDSVVDVQGPGRKGSSSKAESSRKESSKSQGALGQRSGSGSVAEKSHNPGSLDNDPAGEQSRITTQMLRLTENIEKHLDEMIQEPVPNPDDSLQTSYLSPTQAEPTVGKPVTTVQHRGLQRGEKGPELKQANERRPPATFRTMHTTRVPGTRLGTNVQKLKATTAAFQTVPATKRNTIPNGPSSLSKGLEKAMGHAGSGFRPSPNPKDALVHPKTSTRFQGLQNGHLTRVPVPVTPHSPLITSIAKTTRASIEPTVVTPKAPRSTMLTPMEEVKRPVERPIELDTSGSKQDNINGLVAALVFGVIFLMVVIGLIGRKLSEAYRRHRYTKLDYLINGMYVDT